MEDLQQTVDLPVTGLWIGYNKDVLDAVCWLPNESEWNENALHMYRLVLKIGHSISYI